MYTTCSQHVLSLEFSCTELVHKFNELVSYCGLVDTRIGSEKDLPVIVHLNWYYPEENFLINLGFDSVLQILVFHVLTI